jgi:DNA repair and recombination RAD54-like protein
MPPTQSFKAVSKKPLWQKKKEAKLEEKALREQEKAERDPMDILPRGGSNGANAFISRGANVAVDSSRPGAHILNEGANDQLLVCVDPFIGIKLKPHQVEGVRFLYKNLTEDISQRQSAGTQCSVKGCILADEMGLGKTIQTIALIWTVLKQSPVSSTSPLVRKCCVVCPSSLVFNWQNEFKKWLGDQRLPTLAVLKGGKEAADVVQEFVVGSVKPVLIISYDMLRRLSSKLAKGQFDLLICDEAHKLKNINGNHTIDALNSLPASRRILLSGTPVQNDLQEYYSMINFVRPGLLGAPKQFQKLFADSIVKSRDKRCSDHDKIIGRKRLRQLSKLTSSLLLRRTMADKLICSTMPSKTETLVFCNPSSLQHDLYRALLASAETQKLMRVGKPGGSFAVITRVIKLLNHPTLLNRQEQATENPEGDEVTDLTLASIAGTMSVDDDFVKMHFPANYDEHSLVHSGKFQFLFELLRSIKSSSSDRVVLVSSYTTTLDLLQIFLRSAQYTFLRLDGSVNAEKRRHLVESFNRDKSDVFVFLLSSLAGGVGLNLVAANRLVLIDPSWNPAHDYQAMARIWRFGQLSPCHIYRLITTGTMEEKILQKQLRKGELESLVVDGGESSVRNFDSSDLKRIFILEKTSSDTFDVLTANGLASKNASGRVPLEQLHSQRVGGFRCVLLIFVDCECSFMLCSLFYV